MRHLLGLRHLRKKQVEALLSKADEYVRQLSNKNIKPVLTGKVVANLFFENSTRTRFSFEVAQKRLGAHVLNFQDGSSSTKKGETVADTFNTLAAMGVEAAVVRHAENGLLQQLQNEVHLQLINAGTGTEEHPTQGLLDVLTMYQEFGRIEGLRVAIIGDIQHSRVARSNWYALRTLGAEVCFAGPEEWRPEDEDLSSGTWLNVDEAVGESDVVMMLRVQHERHAGQRQGWQQDTYLKRYGLTEERAKQMKKDAIIMHPAPVNRGVEMESALVESERSRIFKQITNGVAVRMAVLHALLCTEEDEDNACRTVQQTYVLQR